MTIRLLLAINNSAALYAKIYILSALFSVGPINKSIKAVFNFRLQLRQPRVSL